MNYTFEELIRFSPEVSFEEALPVIEEHIETIQEELEETISESNTLLYDLELVQEQVYFAKEFVYELKEYLSNNVHSNIERDILKLLDGSGFED